MYITENKFFGVGAVVQLLYEASKFHRVAILFYFIERDY